MYTSNLFKKWIIDHQNDDYQINVESEQTIKLTTSYGEATIQFTDVTNGTIVEFNIISYKNQEVQFYLHFELNDEMIETLIGLKDKKQPVFYYLVPQVLQHQCLQITLIL